MRAYVSFIISFIQFTVFTIIDNIPLSSSPHTTHARDMSKVKVAKSRANALTRSPPPFFVRPRILMPLAPSSSLNPIGTGPPCRLYSSFDRCCTSPAMPSIKPLTFPAASPMCSAVVPAASWAVSLARSTADWPCCLVA